MRYFFLAVLLIAAIVVSMAGFRGRASRRPPIEIFSDMDRQPKIRPQTPSEFFADGKASRPPVEGTVARDSHFLDAPIDTGIVSISAGATNYLSTNALPVTEQLMARGRQRFEINCSPCHGLTGEGNGVVKSFGLATIRSLHEPRIVEMGDGEIFHVITEGRATMGAYGPNVTVEDRWAIVAYVRALQLARLGLPDDLPADQRTALANMRPTPAK
ncbi:MAG TPA: cytochrome c [Verrucomicrobiae bacterium]|jgi:mono/diheme cytochrome c family protein|nr:cytochrome c [Verrucomicrobiae bacterium]